MFILSRVVIFLEMNKNEKYVESYLDCLDKFTHVNTYHEFDNDIPHLKRGIPILDQYLEYPAASPSPSHEYVPSTSQEHEV